MILLITDKELFQIKSFLFKDNKENMILGYCDRLKADTYCIKELLLPKPEDYKERSQSIVTLKAESAYPLLMKLKENNNFSFLQIHNHVHDSMLYFSPIDNNNNSFNITDIREFNKDTQFFRIVFTPNKHLAQYYDFKKKKFKKIKIKIYE